MRWLIAANIVFITPITPPKAMMIATKIVPISNCKFVCPSDLKKFGSVNALTPGEIAKLFTSGL